VLALVGLLTSIATADTIPPLDLNDFGDQDPLTAVSVNLAGTEAVLSEDSTVFATVLINDPFFGDASIVVGAVNRLLRFEYDFVEGVEGAIFAAHIFDADTGVDVAGLDFNTSATSAGTVSFDLTSLTLLPPNLFGYGLAFELASFDFLALTDDASVTITNLRLVDPDTTVIPEPSTWALFGLGAAFLVWRRRKAAEA
jgi:hypothetical protein